MSGSLGQPPSSSGQLADLRSAIFLKWMMDESKTLVPENVDGRITYSDVDRLAPGVDPVEFLNRLSFQGMLKKEKYVTEVLCPSCGSVRLRDRYTCTFCRGDNIETGDLMEHYACGYSDFEANFQKEGRLICPKCRREMKIIGTDYRRVGKVFKCNDCGKDSSIPRIIHSCQDCGVTSTFETTRLRTLYQYRVDEEKKKEIASLTGIYLPLMEFLQNGGFKVESPVAVKGESGMDHSFDILATFQEKRTFFDIVVDSEAVGETAVVTFFTKSLDVAHEEVVLICVPKASDRARGLCRAYGIGLVEGEGISQILSSMATLAMKRRETQDLTVRTSAPSQVVTAPPRSDVTKTSDLRTMVAAMEERSRRGGEEAATTCTAIAAPTVPQVKTGAATGEAQALQSRISALEQAVQETLEQSRRPGTTRTMPRQSRTNIPVSVSSAVEQGRTTGEDPRLRDLEALYRQGKMGEEEYKRNKQRILRSIGS